MPVLSVIAYATTLFVFVGIDLVWLTWVGGPAYRAALGDILLSSVRIAPALAFYLVYPLGLTMFAVMPALGGASLAQTMVYGALFGFFTYATYDLTNLATLRNWTMNVTLMDIGWGCVLCAVVAVAAAAIVSHIGAHFGLMGA